MNWRATLRRAFPYLTVGIGAFLIAYLFVFLFAFRSDVVPDDAVVPNVVGMMYEDAADVLQRAGFYARQGQQRISKTAPTGIVLEQTPAGGGRQKKGTDVLLAISAGKKTATVPQVSGLTPQEARVAIENAGFQLGRVVELTSDYPRGTVYAVTPAPGTQIDLPAEVNLTVSAGPSVVQAPDLVGREIPDARSVLEQSGLRLGAISRDTSSTQTENTVLHQNPPAGTAVPAGSLVSVTVSRFPAVRPLPPPSSTFDSTVFRRKIPAP